jgi:hypothetical protein
MRSAAAMFWRGAMTKVDTLLLLFNGSRERRMGSLAP